MRAFCLIAFFAVSLASAIPHDCAPQISAVQQQMGPYQRYKVFICKNGTYRLVMQCNVTLNAQYLNHVLGHYFNNGWNLTCFNETSSRVTVVIAHAQDGTLSLNGQELHQLFEAVG